MIPKLSYLPSGQFDLSDDNKKESKYFELNEHTKHKTDDDVNLEENFKKKSNPFEDLSNPYYIGLNKDLTYDSKKNSNECLILNNNKLILSNNKNLEKQNSNFGSSYNKKNFLFDKQSLLSCSSSSSLSSYTTSSSSISPISDHRKKTSSSSDSESLTFVSLISPLGYAKKTTKILTENNNLEKSKSNEKKEEENSSKNLKLSNTYTMKKIDFTKSKECSSYTLPRCDMNRPKIFNLNADLIRQKTLLRKNNFEEQKKFMKKMIERPLNDFELNRNNSNTSSVLSLFEMDDSNSDNELTLIQSKLESSQLSILSKNKLVNESISTSPTNSTSSLLIVSRHGTVRGAVNHVRTSLKEIFKEPQITNPVTNAQLNIKSNTCINPFNCTKANEKLYLHYYLARDYEVEEHMKIVIYTTSLQVVRLSHDKCKRVKKILQNHCVRYEEKDLYKNKEYQRELKYRLNLKQIDVPHIFFNGKHVGNCDELELFSDQGVLNKLFKDLEKIKLRIYCAKCGGYRFVLCTLCNGSKRKYNNFTNLKCTHCNEDGLIRCDECLDQQE
ncbi:unnamed protein product [Brachionus calyciflorus]|uniref:Glutaredoxin domain-containing protein n=1 Tax=Brachionus calyciflorus TaxID=104777 RepID=A0A814G047_9BILA|nr:unnamed protein product [Brachionus calyciflorus]